MTITEMNCDLFKVPHDYYLAHCISGDYALGAGIAKTFNDIYCMRYKLKKFYPIPTGQEFANVGKALLVGKVFNLVTKERYWHKPTYATLYEALCNMHDLCIDLHIAKLAMPMIGCGLDKLKWNEVKELIEDVFYDLDIEILVCKI